MYTKTRPKKFAPSAASGERKRPTYKESYRAKLETIRRKEVRTLKKSFDKARSTK